MNRTPDREYEKKKKRTKSRNKNPRLIIVYIKGEEKKEKDN